MNKMSEVQIKSIHIVLISDKNALIYKLTKIPNSEQYNLNTWYTQWSR